MKKYVYVATADLPCATRAMISIHWLILAALLNVAICRGSCRLLAGKEVGAEKGAWANNIASTTNKKEERPPEEVLAVSLLLTVARGPSGKDLLRDARAAIRTMEKYLFPYTPSKL